MGIRNGADLQVLWRERKRLHLVSDLAVVIRNALWFDPSASGDLRPILGNHVILKMHGRDVFALFAHAREGSIRVRGGQDVEVDQQLAEVGHSGNSTAPHLHFHLMDRADVLHAQGLPCCFERYETLEHGVWREVVGGIPPRRVLIRRGA